MTKRKVVTVVIPHLLRAAVGPAKPKLKLVGKGKRKKQIIMDRI